MAAALSQATTNAGRWLRNELVSARPLFLFFLAGFLILLLLIKLVLKDFSVETRALPKALLGALLAAKAALLLDETPLARMLENYRRIVAVSVKTVIYGLATLILGYAERLLEALRKLHRVGAAFQEVFVQTDHYRLLAWILGISIVFALYFASSEISLRMGEGALGKLFFDPPATYKHATPSKTSAAKPGM